MENIDLTDFEHWLRVKKKLSDRSVETYAFRIRRYMHEYGAFTDENLIEWKENQIDELKAPNYINQGIAAFTVYREYLDVDVEIPGRVATQKKQFINDVISRADYDYLLKYLVQNFGKRNDKRYERIYIAVRIMGTTGLRMNELLAVKVEDLRLGYFDIYGKRSKNRRIYIPENARRALLNLLFGSGKNSLGITSGFVVIGKDGERMKARTLQYLLKEIGKEAGIDESLMHPHGFRHFFAKEFLRTHNDICLLADLLGHSKLETTRIYLKMTSREQADVVNRVVTW